MLTQESMTVCSETNCRAAERLGVDSTAELISRMRGAFEMFDNQSATLQSSFETLKSSLAKANHELQDKNRSLAEHVNQLHQVSSRLRHILESIGDGVLVVNSALVIEHCNPAARHIMGITAGEAEGREYHALMNGLGNRKAVLSAILSGHLTMHEQRTRHCGDGSSIHVLASVGPIRSPNGQIIGAVEVLRDITGLRLLEERMNQQKRIAALGEMAASVAHEIRNPLGTIEGFARLLKQDLDTDGKAEHARLASKIIEGTQNLNYVITSLLTYVRPMALNCEPFEAAVMLESAEELLVGTARQHGVRLTVRKQPGTVRSADIRQIRQVIVNLGRNAIEACRAGDGEVLITCTVGERKVAFSVTDNGCGIPEEDLTKVFDPFFTRKEGGTGLGLALSHKIVSAHGGEIILRGLEGHGTSASVILPQPEGEHHT